MDFRILFYCPDRHIEYDGLTPEEVGVGGGITARVRMGRALARRGHTVLHVGNCPRATTFDGVEFFPLDEFGGARVDVAVLTTSGDELDLRPALDAGIEAQRTIVWVHGTEKPKGFDDLEFDAVYAVSEFIRGVVIEEWGVSANLVEVTYNGYEPAHFEGLATIERDPYRLIYFSHPSKGLEPALGVVRILRGANSRFHLVVCGGDALWGGTQSIASLPEGATSLGMIGQRRLARELKRSGFSLQLQRREEPGALAIPDAQRAGCVILASPVGVYPELVARDSGGVLAEGDPWDFAVQQEVAEVISALVARPNRLSVLHRRAEIAALPASATSRRWESLWLRSATPGV